MPPLSGLSSSTGIMHESFRRDSVSNGEKLTGVTFGKVIVFIVVVFSECPTLVWHRLSSPGLNISSRRAVLISFVWVMAWKYRTTRMPQRRGSWRTFVKSLLNRQELTLGLAPRVQAHAHAKNDSISKRQNSPSSSSTPYDDGRTSPSLWRSESRASIPLPVYTPPPPAYFPRGQHHVSADEMHDTRSLMGEQPLSGPKQSQN